MTERLYYTDSYLREFAARVVDVADQGRRVYLDRTAFYPTSGGQPHDIGFIGDVPVIDVVDEGARIAHCVAAPVAPGEAACRIDWPRRFDHMQQHSGQHLLSAVWIERFGIETVSFHLGGEVATIDLDAAALANADIREVERRANEAVCENRPVTISFEECQAVQDLRRASEREGELRVVRIAGLDAIACGGTHVRATGEIGPILLRRREKVRNTMRLEFLCGSRAVRRARRDFEALSQIADSLSASLDGAPELIAAQMEAARAAEKLQRKLEADLAGYRGRDLYDRAEPDAHGRRRIMYRVPSAKPEDLRNLAQSVTARPGAIFVAAARASASVLLAVSPDLNVDAAKALRSALEHVGGRGGGTARIAQGSVPNPDLLETALETLQQLGAPPLSV